MILLKNRAVIEVSGDDRVSFLQGLLTNDMSKLKTGVFTYALMLSPQGRFLYDFFVLTTPDKILLDAPQIDLAEILKKFRIYKLRAKVELAISPLFVYAQLSAGQSPFLPDPRASSMGYRAILELATATEDFSVYEEQRIKNLIPDAEQDFIKDKSFPLEYGMDKLGAIDFEKGCYVGQEVTTRTHHRGVVRKGLYRYQGAEFPKGTEITADGNKIGIILGSGICLLNHEELQTAKNHAIMVSNESITIVHD
ncbi:MAG: YgfZ/GcvT domain-containing protein [Rickettsiales bacterium]